MGSLTTKGALQWCAAGLYHTGLLRPLAAAANYATRQPVFQILTYHRVNDEHDPFFPSVSTAVFAQHMAYLARAYRVLTVETLVERMLRDDLPRNVVALTFDDGYRDTLTHAAPILARHSLPATVFLATGFIGTAEIPWFDRLALAFKTTRAEMLLTPWRETLRLAGVAERLHALERILAWLKRRPDAELHRAVDDLLRALQVTDDRRPFTDLMLSWDDVHALTGLGFSIGAHTVSHPILSRVSPQRAMSEILGARAMIEAACGAPPQAFAYPNGRREDYTDRVIDMVRKAGFACAVTTRFGTNAATTSPWELRRGGPWERHVPTFALKLATYRTRAGQDEQLAARTS